MKRLIFILFVLVNCKAAKAQCIWIYVSEKVKGAEIPIERTEFDVVVNDTLKRHMTSKNDGSLGKIYLEKGKYKVKVSNPEYIDAIETEVVVNESRTTNLTVNLVKAAAIKEEEKKK